MFEIHLNHWELSPELQLLLDIVLRKKPEIPEGLDWDAFEAALRQHRLQPLLIRGLRGMDAAEVDRIPVLKQYRGQQGRYATESFQRLQAIAEANQALSDAGIRMISMKGPMLAMELYGDPSLRTSRDLDVMVPKEELDRAGEILVGLGYEPEDNPFHKTPLRRKYYCIINPEKHMVYQRGDICLELHWRENAQTEEDFDALWERREERLIMGKQIAVLGADDRYPALIIHAAEHGFHRLRWLLDLYELQKKPDFRWERVYRQLSEQNLGELLLETLIVLYRMALPGLADIAFDGVRLTTEEGGICLQLEDPLSGEGRRALALSEAAYPLWRKEALWGDPRQREYDRLLPVSLIHKTPLQMLLLACGPSVFELKLVDLPDWLFWLYFFIRPFNWIRRKLFRK